MGGRIKREVAVNPLPSRLGKIKIGEMRISQSGKTYPSSSDHFIARGINDAYTMLWHQAYGAQPKSVLVYFPSDDPELVCREEYVYRDKAGKKIATGDGETFLVWSEKEQKRVKITTDKFPNIMEQIRAKYPSPSGWQVTLTLNVVCPLMNRVYGVWTIETRGAASSIPRLRDTFDAMLEKNGHISGVLCDLIVEMVKSDSPGGGKFPVLTLVPNESKENIDKIQALKMLSE